MGIKKCNKQTLWQVSKWDNHACVTMWYSTIIIVSLVLKQLCADFNENNLKLCTLSDFYFPLLSRM